MYKKILVPLDGSDLAEGVLTHAKALAYSEGAEIVLLRVAANPALEFAFSDPALAQSAVAQFEAESQQYIDDITDKLKKEGFKVSAIIAEGLIAETILQVAEDIHADTIAMSTHGRTGPARWLIGSVADRVINSSKIPVMLIRPTQI